jgi:hypothetical protein
MEQSTLFKTTPDLSRNEKTKKSRQNTADLTLWAINYLNDSGQFRVHRSNNTHPPIIKRSKKEFNAFDENGKPIVFTYDSVEIMYKKNSIKQKILDISGVVLPYNGNANLAGHHIECEVKTGSDSLSEGQSERIALLKKAGAISFVFDSKETFLIQIDKFMVNKLLAF